jgi:transposase InsO family protein
LAKDAFLRYPDHNKQFDIYCDASDLQLGAAILQDGKPVAYYSRKLNSAQRNYTVGEKELLSIVEMLKTFRTMLYGCPNIHVYTDHKNNTFKNLQTQRVLRWRLFLEDHGVQFHYIKGETNSLADALSRLPFDERQNPSDSNVNTISPARDVLTDSSDPLDEVEQFHQLASHDDDLIDCFVHLPTAENIPNVLDYRTIAQAQTGDAWLQQLRHQHPAKFSHNLLAPNTAVWCYTAEPNKPWKVYLPDNLLLRAIQWYHHALSHIGQSRLGDTMSLVYYHPKLRATIEAALTKCRLCQEYKNVQRGHGQLAPREAALLPWSEVAVDLIGPWTLTVSNQTMTFNALTIIDLVTNLVELVRLDNKTSDHVALQFVNTWLARYPRPTSCVYDQGGEFTGFAFQAMLDRHNIHRRPTTAKNPQANVICERMHQSVGNSLRVLRRWIPPAGITDARQLVDTALANAMYATRASLHSALQMTPGALSFHRDMVLNIPLVADLNLIREKRQHLIDQRLIVNNRKRFAHDYQPNQEVLKLVYEPGKLEPCAVGPYRIVAVHTNGTVTIRIPPHMTERISLRNIKPFNS